MVRLGLAYFWGPWMCLLFSFKLWRITTLVRHVTIWIVAGQVDQTPSWVIEREAASLEYSALRIVTVLVLVNELGRND